jgi:hypothetical protein
MAHPDLAKVVQWRLRGVSASLVRSPNPVKCGGYAVSFETCVRHLGWGQSLWLFLLVAWLVRRADLTRFMTVIVMKAFLAGSVSLFLLGPSN